MRQPLSKALPSAEARPLPSAPWRQLRCIRWSEVFVLQAPPVMGLAIGVESINLQTAGSIVATLLASLLLVAHVFVTNDLAGWTADQRDPGRRPRTMAMRGVTKPEMIRLSVLLGGAAAVLGAAVGPVSLLLCVGLGLAGLLYSDPRAFWKGVPAAGTLLHMVAGTLHFLLGVVAVRSIDPAAIGLGLFFGLVFSAGHLMHEVRDRKVDEENGIRTNAVAFGSVPVFGAGLGLFSLALVHLAVLALAGLLPKATILTIAVLPIHLAAGLAVLRRGLSPLHQQRFQLFYRIEFALVGLALVTGARFW